jgi:hypothetical protein
MKGIQTRTALYYHRKVLGIDTRLSILVSDIQSWAGGKIYATWQSLEK